MSETQQSTNGSTGNNQISSARRVQRLAEARQHSDDAHAAIPDETSVSADMETLFDDDGRLISPEEAVEVEVGGEVPDPSEMDAEAFLAEVAPERLETIEAQFEDLPGTRGELVEYHARKVINEAEERGEALHVGGDGELFTHTIHQDERGETVSELLKRLDEEDDAEADGQTIEECPKCGAENVSADTVELQTRAADESGTQVTKTGCGCTLRNYD